MIARLRSWLMIVCAALLAIGAAYFRGRRHGRDATAARQHEKVQAVQGKWDAIENARPDFDAAIGRLRDRARR